MIGLIRISSPQFVAGAETDNGVVVRAAPILGRKVEGMTGEALAKAARAKGWTVEVLGAPFVEQPEAGA
jgi:hypothetical protein